MLDSQTRRLAESSLKPISRWLSRHSVTPTTITSIGLAFGLAACLAVAVQLWWLGLVLWCANRAFDGLDGLVARLTTPTDIGGFYDLLADFVVYSGFVAAVAIALPDTRLAATVLLMSYYVSGAALLTWSSLMATRLAASERDERSLNFLPGLAEGTETIIAYVSICLFPGYAESIMWVFAAMVFVTAGQRFWWARKTLT